MLLNVPVNTFLGHVRSPRFSGYASYLTCTMGSKCFLLKDITRGRLLGLNPRPLSLEFGVQSTRPPRFRHCFILRRKMMYFKEKKKKNIYWDRNQGCLHDNRPLEVILFHYISKTLFSGSRDKILIKFDSLSRYNWREN